MPATTTERPARRARRVLLGLVAALLALVIIAVVDVALVASRFKQIELTLPAAAEGPQTWVIVGLDDREDVSEEVGKYTDDPALQPGTRADIIIVVTAMPDGVRGLSIPRDVVVGEHSTRTQQGTRNRMANQWAVSPQNFVDMMCNELNIPADHLVSVNMQAVVEVVDALGGVEVNPPYPIQDLRMEFPAGPQTLDGIHALNYVRSRKGLALIDGEWVLEPYGDAMRQQRTAEVMQAAIAKLKAQPWLAQQVAWNAAPHVGVDAQTSMLELLPLLQLDGIQTLPTSTAAGTIGGLDFASERAIAERGYVNECVAP